MNPNVHDDKMDGFLGFRILSSIFGKGIIFGERKRYNNSCRDFAIKHGENYYFSGYDNKYYYIPTGEQCFYEYGSEDKGTPNRLVSLSGEVLEELPTPWPIGVTKVENYFSKRKKSMEELNKELERVKEERDNK